MSPHQPLLTGDPKSKKGLNSARFINRCGRVETENGDFEVMCFFFINERFVKFSKHYIKMIQQSLENVPS